MVELGGRGGVYQHAVETARIASAGGTRVVLHTASDCEFSDPRVDMCLCFDWQRGRNWRTIRLILGYFFRTMPHLVTLDDAPIWFQGMFKHPLTAITMVVIRCRGRRVLFSPHNVFVRRGGRLNCISLAVALRVASVLVTYNENDKHKLSRRHARVRLLPLFQYSPDVDPLRMDAWRRSLRNPLPRVCSVGQIRVDKNLPMLVDACHEAGLRLVVAGVDDGGLDELRGRLDALADDRTVLEIRYLELGELVALIATVGVVALPYSHASQSGVAALAKQYGAVVVANRVGGLADQADIVVDGLDPSSWALALRRASRIWAKRVPGTGDSSAREALRQFVEEEVEPSLRYLPSV